MILNSSNLKDIQPSKKFHGLSVKNLTLNEEIVKQQEANCAGLTPFC